MDTFALVRVQMNTEVDRKVRKRRSLHCLPAPRSLPPRRRRRRTVPQTYVQVVTVRMRQTRLTVSV